VQSKKFAVALPPHPRQRLPFSALCAGILSILISVFASLFAKREWDLGRSPNKQTSRKKRKKHFARFVQMSVFQKR
jgi:hypothetical protein